jgi:hypothetical protein
MRLWDTPWLQPSEFPGLSSRVVVSRGQTSDPDLEFYPPPGDTLGMNTGHLIYILSRLILGALASLLAIVVWSRTRDAAWMLMVAGILAGYAETLYSVLGVLGITAGTVFSVESVPIAALALVNLPVCFFIAAFSVMIARKFHR